MDLQLKPNTNLLTRSGECPKPSLDELQQHFFTSGWALSELGGKREIPVSFSVNVLSVWDKWLLWFSYVNLEFIRVLQDWPTRRLYHHLQVLDAAQLKAWLETANIDLLKSILLSMPKEPLKQLLEKKFLLSETTASVGSSSASSSHLEFNHINEASILQWSPMIDWDKVYQQLNTMNFDEFIGMLNHLGFWNRNAHIPTDTLPYLKPLLTSMFDYMYHIYHGWILHDIAPEFHTALKTMLRQWNEACGQLFKFKLTQDLGPKEPGIVIIAVNRHDAQPLPGMKTLITNGENNLLLRTITFLDTNSLAALSMPDSPCNHEFIREINEWGVVHELGHAFGLVHTHSISSILPQLHKSPVNCSAMAYIQEITTPQDYMDFCQAIGLFSNQTVCHHPISLATAPGITDQNMCRVLYKQHQLESRWHYLSNPHSQNENTMRFFLSQSQECIITGIFRGAAEGFLRSLQTSQGKLCSPRIARLLTQLTTACLFYYDAPFRFSLTLLQAAMPIYYPETSLIESVFSHGPTAVGLGVSIYEDLKLWSMDHLSWPEHTGLFMGTVMVSLLLTLLCMYIGSFLGKGLSYPVNKVISTGESVFNNYATCFNRAGSSDASIELRLPISDNTTKKTQ